jgi:hypothetical protein
MISSTPQTKSQEIYGSCRTTDERGIGIAHEENAHHGMLPSSVSTNPAVCTSTRNLASIHVRREMLTIRVEVRDLHRGPGRNWAAKLG